MLRGMRVVDRRSLDSWYQEARRLQASMLELEADVPHFHFLMHYLIDADIRLKDPRHAASQNERLAEVLKELEMHSGTPG